jgi:hypothetical protein
MFKRCHALGSGLLHRVRTVARSRKEQDRSKYCTTSSSLCARHRLLVQVRARLDHMTARKGLEVSSIMAMNSKQSPTRRDDGVRSLRVEVDLRHEFQIPQLPCPRRRVWQHHAKSQRSLRSDLPSVAHLTCRHPSESSLPPIRSTMPQL